MGSFKISRLSTLVLIAVLGLIVAILIAPQVDLPDYTFQRNSSPLAMHALSHHVPEGNASCLASLVSLQPDAVDPARTVSSSDLATEAPSVPHPILRC